MAGTLSGLPLSQQFDINGRPLSGCLLFTFAANTTTPLIAFQDVGLTLPLPWPLAADASGRIPMFYLPDGACHARLVDKTGVVQFDSQNLLVIGPSGGGGGSSQTVDPTTVFATGDIKWQPIAGVIAGWVRLNGRTIGSITSGANERANADAQNLFQFIWNNFPDAKCPVVGGRGSSAAADWAANKQITLLDMRGRSLFGLDDMGNALANRITSASVTSSGDTPSVAAASGGEDRHTLTANELAPHAHTYADPTHSHGQSGLTAATTETIGTGTGTPVTVLISAESANTTASGVGIAINNNGGGSSHNNMSPFMLGTWYWKL